ncbi:hypothetical protein D9757_003596 [Collybiopsis confluens]|uniref:Uncharacterized protein n=1 Tax=Collybiopsis confluens TaxID=2823264 RepID=A0A8H5HUP9_9AGAR|nr:hypothetical protein D9757_003596 [Collybiopsis confluens]
MAFSKGTVGSGIARWILGAIFFASSLHLYYDIHDTMDLTMTMNEIITVNRENTTQFLTTNYHCPHMLLGGFLLTVEEGRRFLGRDPNAVNADVVSVALDLRRALKSAHLMLELVTWPVFSYLDDPKDTLFILPSRAANFSDLQFSIIGWKYKRLPQFPTGDRERVVLKKLEMLGLEVKDLQFTTVFKHEHAVSQVRPVPNWVQAPWPPPYHSQSKER